MKNDLCKALLVFLGGGIGCVLRYATTLAFARVTAHSAFPWSIFVANISGSFALGFLFGWPPMRAGQSAAWFFCATGVLGGYTTFSTLSSDSWVLLQNGHGGLALINSIGSSILGIAAAALGWKIASTLAA